MRCHGGIERTIGFLLGLFSKRPAALEYSHAPHRAGLVCPGNDVCRAFTAPDGSGHICPIPRGFWGSTHCWNGPGLCLALDVDRDGACRHLDSGVAFPYGTTIKQRLTKRP